jgi:ADP-heptose:LPS heptosyltransferase
MPSLRVDDGRAAFFFWLLFFVAVDKEKQQRVLKRIFFSLMEPLGTSPKKSFY